MEQEFKAMSDATGFPYEYDDTGRSDEPAAMAQGDGDPGEPNLSPWSNDPKGPAPA